MRQVSVQVWLSDEQSEALRARIEQMNRYIEQHGKTYRAWDEASELASLIVIGLEEHRARQQRAVERAHSLEDALTVERMRFVSMPAPEWLQQAVGDPMESFPADLSDELRRIREGGQG